MEYGRVEGWTLYDGVPDHRDSFVWFCLWRERFIIHATASHRVLEVKNHKKAYFSGDWNLWYDTVIAVQSVPKWDSMVPSCTASGFSMALRSTSPLVWVKALLKRCCPSLPTLKGLVSCKILERWTRDVLPDRPHWILGWESSTQFAHSSHPERQNLWE